MDSSIEATIPQSLIAEQETLGWILSGDRLATFALSQLDETDFYREAHRLIFRA